MKRLEKKLSSEYSKAAKTVEGKLTAHLNKFKKLDAQYSQLVADRKMDQSKYLKWRKTAMMTGKKWQDTREVLVSDMNNANKIAIGIINDSTIDAYALNMNYGTYEVESGTNLDTSFTLYDHATVENLMKDDPQIIPKARLDIPKDKLWNRQKLTSAIAQGILTGDSIPEIAERLTAVAGMNANAAIRNARTYTTAAENKGRVDSYYRAQGLGIELKQEWMATLDMRTRSSHRHMDGEKAEVGKKFSNGLRFPGDPEGKPWEIYNCRCTLVAAIDGFDDSAGKRFSRLPEEGMTYEEWKNWRDKEPVKTDYGYTTRGLSKPIRPRKQNFSSDDDWQMARDNYKKQKEKYDLSLDDAVKRAASVHRFDSKDDFVKWANRNGIEVDKTVLANIDLRAFNEASYAIDEMFDRFPEIASYNFEYFDGSIQKTTFRIGATNDGLLSANGGLNFNPDYFSNYEYGLREAFEQQTDGTLIRGDGTFSSLIRHEYGHNVQDYIENKIASKYHANVDDWRQNFSTFDEMKTAREAYFAELNKYKNDLRSLAGKNGASEYSNTNMAELFAEGFSAYTSNENTEFSNGFGSFLTRWY